MRSLLLSVFLVATSVGLWGQNLMGPTNVCIGENQNYTITDLNFCFCGGSRDILLQQPPLGAIQILSVVPCVQNDEFLFLNFPTAGNYSITVHQDNSFTTGGGLTVPCVTYNITANSNITNAGSIGGTETVCAGSTPTSLTNITTASGDAGCGTITYQWQQSTDGGGNWNNILSSNSATYTPPALSQTTSYRRGARCSNCSAFVYTSSITKTVSENVSAAGSIAGNQTICGAYNPSEITSSAPASGGTAGTIQYQWQQSSTGTGGWTDIVGATGTTYTPPNITQTTFYRRGARRSICTAWLYSNTVEKAVVNNITSGGTVGGAQQDCGAFTPSQLTSVAAASGGSGGTIEYQWQQSTDGGTNWTNMSGATSETYSFPGNITVTTQYRRGARRSPCAAWVYSNTVIKEVVTNLTNAGTIGSNETHCGSSFTPAPITSITAASGGSGGTIEYQWQQSLNGGLSWTDISAATGANYSPPNISATRDYRRGARRSPCTAWVYSGVVTKAVVLVSVPTISGTTTICSGASTTLTASASGATGFSWNQGLGTGANKSVSPTANTTYTVTATYSSGCTASASATVVVNALPVINITGNNNICASQSTVLTASGASTYAWSWPTPDPPPAGTASGATITVTPPNTTTYNVVGTDANGCTGNSSRTVTVNANPTAAISGNLSICSGASTTLTASGGSVFTWSTGATTASITVSPTAASTPYAVTVGSGSCQASTSVTVTVIPVAVPTISGPTSVCEGSSINLVASAPGTGNTFSWNQGLGTGASKVVSPTANTTYIVTVTYSNGCTATATHDVVVNSLPSVSVAGNTTLCAGEGTLLVASGAGSAGTYAWSTGANTASINVTPSTTTNYIVTGQTSAGCQSSITVTVSVTSNPVANVTGNLVICNGQSTTLTASGGANFSWNTGQTTQSITVSPSTTTNYQVTVSTGNCTASTQVTVTVNPLPNIVTIVPNGSLCQGTTATVSASAGNPPNNFNYLWDNGSTTTSATKLLGPSNEVFAVTVTNNQTGCVNTAQANVLVTPAPSASIGGNASICRFEITTLSVLTSASSPVYAWSTGQTTFGITISPNSTTNYSLTVTDGTTGCSAQASRTVTVTPAPGVVIATASTNVCSGTVVSLEANSAACGGGGCQYLWENGQTTQTVTALMSSPSVFRVTLTAGNNCTDSASTSIGVLPAPTLQIQRTSLDSCVGFPVNFTSTIFGGTPPYTYFWSTSIAGGSGSNFSFSPSVAGSYPVSLTITDANGCQRSAQQTVVLTSCTPAQLIVSPGPSSGSAYCEGRQVSIFLNTPPSGATYLWNTGQTTAFITPTLTTSQSYEVTISVNGVEVGSFNTGLLEVVAASVDIVSASPVAVCSPSASSSLNLVATGSFASSSCLNCAYEIFRDGLSIHTGIGLPASYVAQGQGNYQARITGCSFGNLRAVPLSPILASVAALPNTPTVCQGTVVQMSASPVCTTCSYQWSNGQTTAQITATQAGVYAVTVADLQTGCNSVATHGFSVTSPSLDTTIFFPVASSETAVNLRHLLRTITPNTVLPSALTFASPFVGTDTVSFNARLAGVGVHPIIASVRQGACVRQDTGYIQVIPPPVLRGLVRDYCSGSGSLDTLRRDTAYPFINVAAGFLTATRNQMAVTMQSYTTTNLPRVNPNSNSEFFVFNPSNVVGTFSILTLQYFTTIVRRDAGGNIIDSLDVVTGTVRDTQFVAIADTARILTQDTLYCKNNEFRSIRLQPLGGTFTIRQLNGSAAGSVTTVTATQLNTTTAEAFINPALLHQNETVDVFFQLIYDYTQLGCQGRDSLRIVIPNPANTSFATTSGQRRFCDNSPPDFLTAVQPGGSFFINGVGVSTPVSFNPRSLNPGLHFVAYERTNAFGCLSRTTDTFEVLPLPNLQFTALPSRTFCAYDNAVLVRANPLPSLGSSGSLEMRSRLGQNSVSNPFNFEPRAFLGGTSIDTVVFVYSFTDSNSCTALARDTVVVFPKPQAQMTPLEPIYCADAVNPQQINLNLRPQTGGIARLFTTGTNGNLNIPNAVYEARTSFPVDETITYIYTDSLSGCGDTISQTTRVTSFSGSLPVFVRALPDSACFSGDTLLVVANRPGGATNNAAPPFFRSSIATPNGGIVRQSGDSLWFVPNQAQVGLVNLSYTFGGTDCAVTVNTNMNILSLPDLSVRYAQPFPDRDTICFSNRDSFNIFVVDRRNSDFNPLPSPLLTITGLRVQGRRFIPNLVGPNVVTVSYADNFGCRTTVVDTIQVLDNPTPTIVGLNNQYCYNAPVRTFAVNPDYGFWRWNGADVRRLVPHDAQTGLSLSPTDTNAVYVIDTVALDRSLYRFNLGAWGNALQQNARNDSIVLNYRVIHPNGCSNAIEQVVRVSNFPTVSLNRDPAFFPSDTICNNAPARPLQALVNGRVPSSFIFRETGVPVAQFDPKDSLPGNRTFSYAFNDVLSGCSGLDTFTLTVLPNPQAALVGIQPTYCLNGQVITVQGQPVQTNGGLDVDTLFFPSPSLNPLAITAGTNPQSYEIDPSVLGPGTYAIRYRVQDRGGCQADTTHVFSLSPLPQGVQILVPTAINTTNLGDTLVCENQAPFTVTAVPSLQGQSLSRAPFTLLSLNTNIVLDSSSGNTLNINPNNLDIGRYILRYEFFNNVGCSATDEISFEVYPIPQAAFSQLRFCAADTIILADVSTVVNPNDTLNDIVTRLWTYRGSQLNTTDSVIFQTNQPVGSFPVILEVQTRAGCRSSTQGQAQVNPQPNPNFIVQGACANNPLVFIAQDTQVGLTYFWDFARNANDQVTSTQNQISQTYPQPGIYFPSLTVRGPGNCQATDTQRLVVAPVVSNLDQTPYFQSFEDPNNQDWFSSQNLPANQSVWQWGFAQGQFINSNSNVWSILQGQPYDSVMPAAFVLSPCFDFSNSRRPMIRLDYISQMYDVDGVTLEYFDQTSQNWQVLGRKGLGLNWYNNENDVFGLLNYRNLQAGVSLDAWTEISQDWQTARYRLDQFKGQSNVQFRFGFGKMPNIPNTANLEGFAFDNIWIGERSRNVLLEHFANVHHGGMGNVNRQIYNQVYSPEYRDDVIFVQYQTDQPLSPIDSINRLNSADNNARRLLYGATNATAVINGNFFQGPTPLVSPIRLDSQLLLDPAFRITLNPIFLDPQTNQVNIDAIVHATQELPWADYAVFALITEDSVINGGLLQRQTMRQYLPSHGSTPILNRSFSPGDTLQIQRTTVLNPAQHDYTRLQALVLVQNDSSKQVFQVVSTRNFNRFDPTVSSPQVQADAPQLFEAKLFPNPNTGQFQVTWQGALQGDYFWELYDLQGRRLQTGQVPQGSEQVQIQTRDLPASNYLWVLRSSLGELYLQRQVSIRRP